MKKEWKQILSILIFMMLGAALGYVAVITQNAQIKDPEYIKLLAFHNFPVPEPMSLEEGILSMSFVFSGIPTGAIIYRYFADKWFTKTAPKILIAVFTFPFVVAIGAICAVPMIVYKIFTLIKNRC